MNASCQAPIEKLRKQIQGAPTRVQRSEKLLALLNTADIGNRCRDLLQRSLRSFLAATHESRAIVNLKRTLVGLSTHLKKSGAMCPSAGPAPNDSGWPCVKMTFTPGDRFVYRLKTEGDRYEVSATGKPADGLGETVLFIAGTAADGEMDLGAPVMRR